MNLNIVLNIVYALMGSLGFGILFNIKGKNLIFACLGGGLGWYFYLICINLNYSTAFSLFIASLIISIYSEVCARLLKSPVTIFIISSMLPLVPGSGMYYTMLDIVKGNIQSSLNIGTKTLINAGSIASAVVLISSLSKIIAIYRFKKNNLK